MRIGVPPGVGDVYWVLTKLAAYKAAHNIDRIQLCVQATSKPRALEWAHMVDSVDEACEVSFTPNAAALAKGVGGADRAVIRRGRQREVIDPQLARVFWPNAVVDRGEHLSTWLPELPLDLNVKVKTEEMPADRVLVFASSEGTNRGWLPKLGPYFWRTLLQQLAERCGHKPTLIGSEWDLEYRELIGDAPYVDLVNGTSLKQVAGLIERAAVIVGVISGMTILGNHFRTPTVALYPDKHHPMFPRTWVAPDAPYVPIAHAAVPAPDVLAKICAEVRRPPAATPVDVFLRA